MADTTGTAGNSIWSLFKLIFLWLFSFSIFKNYTHALSEVDMADTTGTAGNSIWSLFKLIFLWLFSFSMGSFHFESVFNFFPLKLS